MELHIIHLYPELMSLYGEYANVLALERRMNQLNVTVECCRVSFEDEKDFNKADFIYMGAGTEGAQKAVLENLLPCALQLKGALDGGAVLLFTGNAMEILGASITDRMGKVWPGLELGTFTTVETDKRNPGDVIAQPALWETPAVGFMNKCSVTRGVTTPLFTRLAMGFGNEVEGGAEGYVSGNLFATHLTGPVLMKNPDFLNVLTRRIGAAKGWTLLEALPPLPHMQEAYAVTLAELEKRKGTG